MCVFVCVEEARGECVSVGIYVGKREEREKVRECECLCVCVCIYMCVCVCVCVCVCGEVLKTIICRS